MLAWPSKDLVDGADDLVAAERGDHSLDLPPMAEARDIAVIAAAVGADCRLETGIVAIAGDQLGGIGQRNSAMDEGAVHTPIPSSAVFPDCGRLSSTRR